MPTPGEHKTVQARILEYAEAEGALLGRFRHLHSNIGFDTSADLNIVHSGTSNLGAALISTLTHY